MRETGREGRLASQRCHAQRQSSAPAGSGPLRLVEEGPGWRAIAVPGQGHVSSAPHRHPREPLGLARGRAALATHKPVCARGRPALGMLLAGCREAASADGAHLTVWESR